MPSHILVGMFVSCVFLCIIWEERISDETSSNQMLMGGGVLLTTLKSLIHKRKAAGVSVSYFCRLLAIKLRLGFYSASREPIEICLESRSSYQY